MTLQPAALYGNTRYNYRTEPIASSSPISCLHSLRFQITENTPTQIKDQDLSFFVAPSHRPAFFWCDLSLFASYSFSLLFLFSSLPPSSLTLSLSGRNSAFLRKPQQKPQFPSSNMTVMTPAPIDVCPSISLSLFVYIYVCVLINFSLNCSYFNALNRTVQSH